MDRKHYDQLDSLRGIFIMGILIYHVNASFGSAFSEFLDPVYKYGGYFGNYFFFMLSGFLIAFSYKYFLSQGQISFAWFIKKRLLKLYPLYFITTVVQLYLRILQNGTDGITAKSLLLNGLMMASGWIEDGFPFNTPLWFVSVLILCYIIYYVVCRLSGTENRRYVGLVILLMIWGCVLEIRNWDIPFCYGYNGEGIINFFAGCLLFELYSSLDMVQIRKLSVLGIAVIGLWAVLSLYNTFPFVAADMRFVITFLICPTLILAALTVPVFRKALLFKPLVGFGRISMSIFFWHAPLLKIFMAFCLTFGILISNPQAGFIAYILFVILFCTFSHIVLEKRLNELLGAVLDQDRKKAG